MKPFILAFAAWLTLTHAAFAGPAPMPSMTPADWRRSGIDDRSKSALTELGWHLKDDGLALDPKTKTPAAQAHLDEAVLDLRQRARQTALEKARLLLASGRPLTKEDLEVISSLAPDLPPAFLASTLDPASRPAKLRAIADAHLARIASYFDGSRTLADRQAASAPIGAALGKHAQPPHASSAARTVGNTLRTFAVNMIARDPYGRMVLSRLNGKDGRPDLPPIHIEPLNGPVAAYDFRRGAVIVDHETVLTTILGLVSPDKHASLRQSLKSDDALIAYLRIHPGAITAFVSRSDVILVHELTHAWQDRRDPVLSEIVRGNIPHAQILEYEKEAFITKNLYLHSKLKNNPASVLDDEELADCIDMMSARQTWWRQKRAQYRLKSPAYALDLNELSAIQTHRLETLRVQNASTPALRRDKALDIKALIRGKENLKALEASERKRLEKLEGQANRAAAQRHKHLAMYYLSSALDAPNPIDRLVKLQKAEDHALAAGDDAALKHIRKAKDTKP